MRLELSLHPDSRCDAAARVEVHVERPNPRAAELRYVVTGDITALRLPAKAAPLRADELWRHTCFEAFLTSPSAASYHEFNFSPSSRWAAYRFDGYRSGMAEAEVAPPVIETRRGEGRFELLAAFEIPEDPTRLGLSAVIEETSGRKSYWALAHPGAKPDFHHPASFVHELS